MVLICLRPISLALPKGEASLHQVNVDGTELYRVSVSTLPPAFISVRKWPDQMTRREARETP